MPQYLVVYYSWTGKTAKVANLIAETLCADIEEIRDLKPRDGPFAFAATAFGAVLKRSTPISSPTRNMADFDVVILGCPVWASNMATPMRAYIIRESPRIKKVAVFCTLGGNGGKTALAEMAALCGRPPLAELMVEQSAIASGAWRGLAESFARQIQANEVSTCGASAA